MQQLLSGHNSRSTSRNLLGSQSDDPHRWCFANALCLGSTLETLENKTNMARNSATSAAAAETSADSSRQRRAAGRRGSNASSSNDSTAGKSGNVESGTVSGDSSGSDGNGAGDASKGRGITQEEVRLGACGGTCFSSRGHDPTRKRSHVIEWHSYAEHMSVASARSGCIFSDEVICVVWSRSRSAVERDQSVL